jgi:hypothetical protein
MSPAASADKLEREHQWDIQVATVGLRPLTPTWPSNRLTVPCDSWC